MTIDRGDPTGAHPRLIPLKGLFNMRDIGGYSAGDAHTRWGKLYRSDSLHQLDDADREEFGRLGIDLVLDLRDEEERVILPSRLTGLPVEVIHSPVLSTPASRFIAEDSGLDDFYDHIIDNSGDRLVAALRILARSGSRVVLVHCTSGKDRTGLIVALALSLVGVDRAEIIGDYAATEANLPVEIFTAIVARLRAERVPAAVNLDELVRLSPAVVLERTLARIERLHGSIEAYVASHGLAPADVEALRAALLES